MNQVPEKSTGATTRRTLFLVHGRGTQPEAEELSQEWRRALEEGLKRDHELSLDGVAVQLIYYGDVFNALDPDHSRFDPVLDRADREHAFDQLKALTARQFRRSRYEAVPGQSPLKEFLADLGVPLARAVGLANRRLGHFYPELKAYWEDAELADELRGRLAQPLTAALKSGDHIMVMSHCIGSVISYDAFWDTSEEITDPTQRVDSWVTLGSPLADDDVRRRLGGQPKGFPNLLINWFNLAAEDDPVCHDETVANDFQAMLTERHISRIKDHHIYNLSERYGRSTPHEALGYLMHPRCIGILADWLISQGDT